MSGADRADNLNMSLVGTFEGDTTVAVTFGSSSPGLWGAIVDKITPREPAGSALAGSAWPGTPVLPEPGMFDFVRTTT